MFVFVLGGGIGLEFVCIRSLCRGGWDEAPRRPASIAPCGMFASAVEPKCWEPMVFAGLFWVRRFEREHGDLWFP